METVDVHSNLTGWKTPLTAVGFSLPNMAARQGTGKTTFPIGPRPPAHVILRPNGKRQKADIALPLGPAPSFPPGGAAQDGGADLQEAQGEGGGPARRGRGALPYRWIRAGGGPERRRGGAAARGWRRMREDGGGCGSAARRGTWRQRREAGVREGAEGLARDPAGGSHDPPPQLCLGLAQSSELVCRREAGGGCAEGRGAVLEADELAWFSLWVVFFFFFSGTSLGLVTPWFCGSEGAGGCRALPVVEREGGGLGACALSGWEWEP